MKRLRFAPIIRVSTEDQAQRKDSLILQRKQIERSVEILNGTTPDYCWKYSGQEHATGVEERRKLDQLLRDSNKGIFDAVIVCDASRWSRDNRKSKDGLNTLRDNGIKFFVATTEYNLFSPEHFFFLSMAVEIGEFQANQGSQKSILVRIDKAKRGEPATRLPVGRTWSKSKGWGVDEKVKETWQNIARELLEGKDFVYLGTKYKMSRSYIRYTLLNRCGDTWEQKFHAPRFDIKDMVIPTKVPRLLPDEIIEAVRARVQQNKTIFRRQTKHKYLFTRMLLCGHCGQALYGDTSNGKKAYRHPNQKFLKGQRIKIDCKHYRYVPADLIENDIVEHLFSVFGDIGMIENAAKNAIPNLDELKRLKSQLKKNDKELKNIESAKNSLLDSVEKGVFDSDDIKERMNKHKERESLLNAENIEIKSKIEKIPSEKNIARKARLIKRVVRQIAHLPSHLQRMTFDKKRAFLNSIFTIANSNERRPGIYLKKNDDKDQPWYYEIKGNLNIVGITGRLPMPKYKNQRLFNERYKPEVKTESSCFRFTCCP